MEEAEKFAEKVPKRESGNETSSEGNSGGTRLSISGRFWSTLEVSEASIATSTPVIQLEEIFRRNIQVQAPPPNVWTTMGMGRSLLDPERIARDTTRGGRSLPDTERLNMEEEEVDHCSDIQ